jgi:single-strand DNA-binding protein
MSDVNHVVLIGRLTRDAELKFTSGGMAVCRFSLAINRRRKNGDEWVDEANFFDVVLFGKSGESVSQYLTKGKQVAVEGELKQDRWEQDGQSRSKIEILANNVQLLGGGNSGGGQGASDRPSSPFQRGGSRPQADERENLPPPSKGQDDFNDDIPF